MVSNLLEEKFLSVESDFHWASELLQALFKCFEDAVTHLKCTGCVTEVLDQALCGSLAILALRTLNSLWSEQETASWATPEARATLSVACFETFFRACSLKPLWSELSSLTLLLQEPKLEALLQTSQKAQVLIAGMRNHYRPSGVLGTRNPLLDSSTPDAAS